MKKNNSKKCLAFLATMTATTISALVLNNIGTLGVIIILFLFAISSWNIYAYFYEKTMFLHYASELEKDAEPVERTITFYITIAFYFFMITGLTWENW